MAFGRLRPRVSLALPKLGWIASIPLAGGDISVLHGTAVECSDDWLVEGVWDAPFEHAGFYRSEAFFGSGLRIDGDNVAAVASTGLVDRLVYFVVDDRLAVSNSLLILLAASGARLHLDHDYGSDCRASLGGILAQPYPFRVDGLGGLDLQQIYHGNVVVGSGKVSVQLRSSVRKLDTYEDYVAEIRALLARVRSNWESPARRVRVSAFSTLSSGYDSAAATCLAREVGVAECFTTIPDGSARGGIELEDGGAVAAALGLVPHLLRPPSNATTADEEYFLAPTVWGSELIFHDMAQHIAATGGIGAVITGYHGDKVWDVHTGGRFLADDILRGDTSGLNLSEIRLKCGFVNVAVPFLLARNIDAIVAIAGSEAMVPWRLNNDYDRPIPRRIVESAGVARHLFGQQKRMVMSYYMHPFNPDLRRRFFTWLDDRLGFGRFRVNTYEMLEAVDWRLNRVLAKIGDNANAFNVPRMLKRRLLRGQDLRQLMFKWAANDLADQIEAAAGPEGLTDLIRVKQ